MSKSKSDGTTGIPESGLACAKPEAASDLLDSGMEFAVDVKLADGEGIRGIYRGPGRPRELVNNDGEPRSVPTHLIQRGNVICSLMGGVKLDRLLSEVAPGTEVSIIRIGDVPVRGGRQRMTDYTVGVPRSKP